MEDPEDQNEKEYSDFAKFPDNLEDSEEEQTDKTTITRPSANTNGSKASESIETTDGHQASSSKINKILENSEIPMHPSSGKQIESEIKIPASIPKQKKLIEEFIDPEDAEEEFIDIDMNYHNDNPLVFSAPKHLYDCLLGLQQDDDRGRFEQSLKFVHYLIRKNLDDLDLHCEDLAQTLLRIHEGLFSVEMFNTLRKRALVALAIMKPQRISK